MVKIKKIERSNAYCHWNVAIDNDGQEQIIEAYLEHPKMMEDLKLNVPLRESFDEDELETLLEDVRLQLGYNGEIMKGFFMEATAAVAENNWKA